MRPYPKLADVKDEALPTTVAMLRGQFPEPRFGTHCVLETSEYFAGVFFSDEHAQAKASAQVECGDGLTPHMVADMIEGHVGGMKQAANLPLAIILKLLYELFIQLLSK